MSIPSPWRADFPIFSVHPELHYLDAAATAQRPNEVIEAIGAFQSGGNANVHRGIYKLAEDATSAYEAARDTVRAFLNAVSLQEIVFLPGATAGMNFLADTWGRQNLNSGDEIVISEMEHHAVIVPWTELARGLGVKIQVAPLTADGQLDMDAYRALLSPKTKLVLVTAMSNVLGTAPDLEQVGAAAHEAGALFFTDAAQAAAHARLDVQALPVDALVFSSHKVYGDFGSGALWMRPEQLAALPPYQRGGSMIRSVSWEAVEYLDAPHRFEAGTANVVAAIGFAAGLRYLERAWANGAQAHETRLLEDLLERLGAEEGVRIFGPPSTGARGPIVSFTLEGVHPHDLAQVLDEHGVAVRAGHHCTQPLHRHLGIPATARASIGVWNDSSDIDALIEGIRDARKRFVR